MSMSDDEIRKLSDLGKLRDEGVLTQSEFEVSKARLLEGAAHDEQGSVAVLEAAPDEPEPPHEPPAESAVEATPLLTTAPKPSEPLAVGVIMVLAIFTAGIGVPIYLWIKQRRRAAMIVAAIVAVMFIAAGTSDSSSSSKSPSAAARPAKSATAEDKAATAAAAAKSKAEERAATVAAAKAAAVQAAAQRRQQAAVAARRRARINNAAFVDERTLALVLKDPDAHAGEMFRVWGSVMQFDSRTGTTEFLADVANRNTSSYGYFDGETALFSGNENQLARFVEDDLFTAVVQVVGSYSYDTAIGGSNAVAQFKIVGGLQRQGSNAN